MPKIQNSIVEELWDYRDRDKSRAKRAIVSDFTWQLVLDKRQCRNLLHDRSRIRRRTLLEAWFACWRHSCHDCPFDALAPAFDGFLIEPDRLTAVAYHQFRKLEVQVSKALRADDVDSCTSLLRDCAEASMACCTSFAT